MAKVKVILAKTTKIGGVFIPAGDPIDVTPEEKKQMVAKGIVKDGKILEVANDKENETLKKENETLKKENETLKKENETLKKENETLKETLEPIVEEQEGAENKDSKDLLGKGK